jgi:hypothetical protein
MERDGTVGDESDSIAAFERLVPRTTPFALRHAGFSLAVLAKHHNANFNCAPHDINVTFCDGQIMTVASLTVRKLSCIFFSLSAQ